MLEQKKRLKGLTYVFIRRMMAANAELKENKTPENKEKVKHLSKLVSMGINAHRPSATDEKILSILIRLESEHSIFINSRDADKLAVEKILNLSTR